MSGWGLALRLARRDAWRAKARSALVLFMIALPVLAVTTALVVMKTAEVTGSEGADRRLGAADARIWTEGPGVVLQGPDPDQLASYYGDTGDGPELTPDGIEETLGRDVRTIPIREANARLLLEGKTVDVEATEVDLSDPLAQGLFELSDGRLPGGPDEVVVNAAAVQKGLSIGDQLELTQGDATPTVVGVGESTAIRGYPVVVGAPGALLTGDRSASDREEWLVDASGPVAWSEVLELNKQGGFVASRAVLTDPPDVAAMAEEMGYETGASDVLAVLALVITMALLEVVLLAGPAFAVGARRLSRSLALISASGGTPRQSRRVVLAGGVVLGATAAVLGCLLGIAVGWALLPLVQRMSATWFGPFEVPWTWLLAVVAFGMLSALLAAVVPAYLASKQDVVAVLAGRRGDAPPRKRTPVFGVVLLGVGIAGAAWGSRPGDSSEYLIAVSAVISVLGMLLVVPLVVGLIARISGVFPLVVRYAARDAARNRTRTVPAVAAVAATVAGVVALGIANASDEAENAATYQPSLAMGVGVVTIYDDIWMDGPAADPEAAQAARTVTWDRIGSMVQAQVTDVEAQPVLGFQENALDGSGLYLQYVRPGKRDDYLLDSYGGALSAAALVSDRLPALVPGLSEEAEQTANDALAQGRAVVFTTVAVTGDTVRIKPDVYWPDSDQRAPRLDPIDLPAVFVPVGSTAPASHAVLPTVLADRVAAEIDREPTTVGILLNGTEITKDQQTTLAEAVGGIDKAADVYVERGYQRPDEANIILLILGGLGGVLMLGGTLTATFLALSDARPDLATLSAVGASPRSRRGIAASYAVVVGFVGALLGAGVGFIPGIAISRPLTRSYQWMSGPGSTGPFLDIPWLLIGGLVVALPLVTALVVGLTARSRLPMVARLD